MNAGQGAVVITHAGAARDAAWHLSLTVTTGLFGPLAAGLLRGTTAGRKIRAARPPGVAEAP